MLKLCPWKRLVSRHSVSETSLAEDGSYVDTDNSDVSVDFGNCSLNACPFYDDSELFANGCRRVGVE